MEMQPRRGSRFHDSGKKQNGGAARSTHATSEQEANMELRGLMGVALATVLTAIIANPIQASAETIKVATEASFPPFSKTEADGSITGFEIDLGNAVCEKAGLQCEWVKQDFDGLIAGLLAGKYNMIFSSMSITEERKKAVDFSLPYYDTPYRFIARKDSGIEISNAGLQGKKVGVYAGATQEKYLKAKYDGVVQIRGYDKIDQINADLVTGRIDMAFNEQLAGAEFLKTADGQGFEFVGPEIRDKAIFGIGAGAVFRKSDTALREKIDAAIRAVYQDGTFDKIAQKYFGAMSVRADQNW
jgi:lysine-arginine-ornithine-binding protein